MQSRARSKPSAPAEKGPIDLFFLLMVMVLLVIGLVMMYSASYANAYYLMGDSFHYIKRQLAFAVVGCLAMAVTANLDYHIWEKWAFPLYAVSIVMLIAVFFFPALNGAHRWINVGGLITFQPSEIAKLALVMLMAKMISRNQRHLKEFKFLILLIAIFVPIAGLVAIEPHLSATVILCILWGSVYLIGGVSLHPKLLTYLLIVVLAIALIFFLFPPFAPVRDKLVSRAMGRIEAWQHPENYARTDGFQTLQSLYAIGSGGLLGTGIGKSKQKYLFLPEPQNDFVFAIVCEELGFVGAVVILLLFSMLVYRGYSIAMKARDTFGCLVAAALITRVGAQTVLNIMVVTNTVPNTGISLPFFSYGGTALMIQLAEMGIILSISRQASIEKH